MKRPPQPVGFPAGAWWLQKLRALGEYLKRTEHSGSKKNGANRNHNPHHDSKTEEP